MDVSPGAKRKQSRRAKSGMQSLYSDWKQVIHNKASKFRQPNRQRAGENPKIKNKQVTRGSETRDNTRAPKYQNTKAIWQGTHSGVGLNTPGNKAQVNHKSNQLEGKHRGNVKQTTTPGKTGLSK